MVVIVLGLVPVALTTRPALAAAARASWGVYTAPGPKNIIGAAEFAAITKIDITHVIDFLPDDSWTHLTTADWAIDAYTNSPYQLVLSVPMIPRDGTSTLAACANGSYNQHWHTIAAQLREAKLAGTIVRPGWEANGGWFPWTAVGTVNDYVRCFRQVVTSMRVETPGLRFDWTVAAGSTPLNGELAYPGDKYVDIVGVDIYDYSWSWYPAPEGVSLNQARQNAVAYAVNGPRGLAYWSNFALEHSKPLALPEWGLSWRYDGHGGGDNVRFVEAVLGFVKDPANRVQYANYFNSPDSITGGHRITGPNMLFPSGAQRILELARWNTRGTTRWGGPTRPREPGMTPTRVDRRYWLQR